MASEEAKVGVMDWWNAPVNEFVKTDWDRITMGCHIIGKRVVCYDYLSTNAFFKSIQEPVTIQSTNNEPMWIVAGLMFLLIICMLDWLEDRGIFK